MLERWRQEDLRAADVLDWTCAHPRVTGDRKLAVLVEEVGEVAAALHEFTGDPADLRAELVQVAAVAVAWLESLPAAAAAAEFQVPSSEFGVPDAERKTRNAELPPSAALTEDFQNLLGWFTNAGAFANANEIRCVAVHHTAAQDRKSVV